jgi:two-component system, NtrC family, sensor histidine kinase PilS
LLERVNWRQQTSVWRQIIQDQSKRMNLIIENVLQLSRRSPAEPQTLQLNEWLEALPATSAAMPVPSRQLHVECERSRCKRAWTLIN